MYDMPDFIVHGDSKSTSAIRWNNVERYNLLLVCKQIFLEALPVISRESYMEIKIYTDDILRRRDRKSNAAYAALLRTKALCQDARKVVLNITPTDWDVEFLEDEQLPRLAALLAGYPKLKDLTLRVRPICIPMNDWSIFHSFFALCKNGVSLCFELLDYEVTSEDEEEMEEIEEQHKATELLIEKMDEDYGGEEADVWVEWNLIQDDREY